MPSLCVISGPPGSGKSTVARILADTAERPTVHLVTDNFYVAIRKGSIPPFLPEAAQQNEVVGAAIIDSMLAYAGGGYDVVVDGIIGPWSLPPFVAAVQRAERSLSFVVLRPSLDCALHRAQAREGRELKASGPIRGLYRAFAQLGQLEHHAIDSTAHTAEETAELVRDGLRAGRFVLD